MKKRAFSLIELSIVILIIGILVTGVTQGSRLISQSRLQNARNLTQSSPVASIKGLTVWFDASSEASFIESEQEDGAEISSWNDINPQSTFKINATSTDAIIENTRPSYVSSCINSTPCVRFDGTNDYLPFTENDFIVGSNYSIFVVESRSDTEENYFLGGGTGSTNHTNMHLGYRTNTTVTQDHQAAGISSEGMEGFKSKEAKMHTFLFSQEIRDDNKNMKYELNGGIGENNQESDAVRSPLISWQHASIGRHLIAGAYFNGDIAEIIIFNRRLKNTEVTEIRDYLSKKYDISL